MHHTLKTCLFNISGTSGCSIPENTMDMNCKPAGLSADYKLKNLREGSLGFNNSFYEPMLRSPALLMAAPALNHNEKDGSRSGSWILDAVLTLLKNGS